MGSFSLQSSEKTRVSAVEKHTLINLSEKDYKIRDHLPSSIFSIVPNKDKLVIVIFRETSAMFVMYLHGVNLFNNILPNYLSCLKNVYFFQLPEGFIKLHGVSKLNFSFSPRKFSKIG